MFTLIIFFSFMMSMLFTQLVNPLSMGITLLLQTLIISIITGALSYSYWFSYILFMIFVGGMLVLFIYISSLASNQNFKFSVKMMNMMTLLLIMSAYLLIIDPMVTSNQALIPTSSIMEEVSTQKISLWIYSVPIMNLTLFVILYLLLTLIVVVKITNMFKLSLRLLN